jgi:hypothetical protein
MDKELVHFLTRIADGIDRLGQEPEIEIDWGPPKCPHCNAFDPQVEIEEQDGSGPLSEYYLEPTCGACRKKFFIVIQGYSAHVERDMASQEIEERKKGGHGNSR